MSQDKSERVRGKLKLSNIKLKTILDISIAINKNASSEHLFGLLKNVLVQDLGIGRFVFISFDKTWQIALQEGLNENQISEINIDSIINQYDDIDVLHSSTETGTNKFEIVVPVFHNKKAFAYLLLGDLQGEKVEISPIIKHLKFIQTLANIIVVALENKRLYEEEIKQIAIKKELEMAQTMQSLLFPRRLPNNKKIEVKAYYRPHSEVSGDYYDVVQIDANRTALCVADVSGKGMSAALLMANFQAHLRAQLSISSTIEELVNKTNKRIIESANYEKFITLFLAIFDAKEQTLTFLNAGHQPALLVSENKIVELKKGCTVLGMFDELPKIESETIALPNHSKLICYTDGLTELEDENGNQLEVEGVANLIDSYQNLKEIKTRLEKRIKEAENKSAIDDDITFLVAEFLR